MPGGKKYIFDLQVKTYAVRNAALVDEGLGPTPTPTLYLPN